MFHISPKNWTEELRVRGEISRIYNVPSCYEPELLLWYNKIRHMFNSNQFRNFIWPWGGEIEGVQRRNMIRYWQYQHMLMHFDASTCISPLDPKGETRWVGCLWWSLLLLLPPKTYRSLPPDTRGGFSSLVWQGGGEAKNNPGWLVDVAVVETSGYRPLIHFSNSLCCVRYYSGKTLRALSFPFFQGGREGGRGPLNLWWVTTVLRWEAAN